MKPETKLKAKMVIKSYHLLSVTSNYDFWLVELWSSLHLWRINMASDIHTIAGKHVLIQCKLQMTLKE